MGKRLIIVRHAKSDWGNFNLKDFDRPLNKRGHDNAPMMVERLIKEGIYPDVIVSSPALRALTTAKYFAKGWSINEKDILLNENIYEANTFALIQVIFGFEQQHNTVVLFGHNPGVSDLVRYLTDADLSEMPTCSVAVIDFPDDDWQMVSAGAGRLVHFDYPKSNL